MNEPRGNARDDQGFLDGLPEQASQCNPGIADDTGMEWLAPQPRQPDRDPAAASAGMAAWGLLSQFQRGLRQAGGFVDIHRAEPADRRRRALQVLRAGTLDRIAGQLGWLRREAADQGFQRPTSSIA
jgi:hypothetical protein